MILEYFHIKMNKIVTALNLLFDVGENTQHRRRLTRRLKRNTNSAIEKKDLPHLVDSSAAYWIKQVMLENSNIKLYI